MPKTTFSYSPVLAGAPASGAAALPAQKAAMQAMHTGLLAVGLTQLSDTGQLDIDAMAAYTTSGAAMVLAGYRIYEMVDSLTPTLRVIIKVEFYRSNMGHSLPQYFETQFNITVGHATDGAGNFVGNSVQAGLQSMQVTNTRITPPATVPSFICVKDHTLMIAVGVGYSQINTSGSAPICAGFAVIGRTRDSSGVADGRGVICYGAHSVNASTSFDRRMSTSVSIPSSSIQISNIHDLTPMAGAYMSMASVAGAPQIQFPMAAVPKIYPFTQLGYYPNGGSLSVADIVQLDIDGAVREYVALGAISVFPNIVGPTVSIGSRAANSMFFEAGVCLLYET